MDVSLPQWRLSGAATVGPPKAGLEQPLEAIETNGIVDIAFRTIVFPFLARLPVAVLRLYRMFQARGAA